MAKFTNSRFNPAPGALDFWNEFRKPNPYRVPLLLASTVPFGLIFYALSDTYYVTPDRPQIDYITTFDPERSDAEIIASNIANQEVKELREARDAELAQRKRDIYKALGEATGMDVEEIERRADEERAAAAAAAERESRLGRVNARPQGVAEGSSDDAAVTNQTTEDEGPAR